MSAVECLPIQMPGAYFLKITAHGSLNHRAVKARTTDYQAALPWAPGSCDPVCGLEPQGTGRSHDPRPRGRGLGGGRHKELFI